MISFLFFNFAVYITLILIIMKGNMLSILLILSVIYNTCECLECYVCKDQENNQDKCVRTIKTCEQGEDVCLTKVSWRTKPYWQRGGDKQFYISKRCATKTICDRERKRDMQYCTHIWYEDWRCTECCLGDRCNYYVILSGSTARSSLVLVLSSLAAAVLGFKIFSQLRC